jgi:hypothetical protein
MHYTSAKEHHQDQMTSTTNFRKEWTHKIWSEGEFRKEWRRATVIPILKLGKNPTNTESYRSISITSCLGKILERIINKRLVYVLESRNLLPEQQYGFRKSRSTTDVLIIFQNHIAETFRKKESPWIYPKHMTCAGDTRS